MTPAAFPGLPITIFPGLFAPAMPSAFTGVSTIDATAAAAAIVWAVGGLIALRIALALSRKSDRSHGIAPKVEPNPRPGLRDAA